MFGTFTSSVALLNRAKLRLKNGSTFPAIISRQTFHFNAQHISQLEQEHKLPSIIATFLTELEAFNFIDKKGLDNVMVERDIFSGRFNVLDLGA